MRHGRTLGGPIALTIANRDYANWAERMSPWPVDAAVEEVHLPRPGHADLAGVTKYGLTDVRDVLERASARETAARVAGGALCKAFLARARRRGRLARACDRHRRARPAYPEPLALARASPAVDESPVRCLDAGGLGGDGRAHQRAAPGERVARRRLRGARLRTRRRPRLARLLGGAARRAARRRRCARSRRSRASASARASRSRRKPGSQAHDEIFHCRRARLLPRDQPRGRARGRNDERRDADRDARR